MLPDLTERLKIHADDSRATPEISVLVGRSMFLQIVANQSSPGKVPRLLTN